MGLISKEVEVTLNGANMQHFKKKGYDLPTHLNAKGKPVSIGEKMIVPIKDLNKGSTIHVDVLCDMCKTTIINMPYSNYTKRMEKDNHCYCKECGYKQARLTNLEKYGVEYYAQTQECQDRKRATCLEKYGEPVSSQAESVKEAFRNTCLEKYGVNHPWKVAEIKNKVDSTIKNRFGVENISQLEEIKIKKAETNKKNTGYAYNLQNPEILNKSKQKNKEIWGTEYPMQSPMFKEKMIELYGGDNPNTSPELKERIQLTNLKRYGGISPISSSQVQEKMRNSMYNNGTVPTSNQQKYIYDLYKGYYFQTELNYPMGKCYSGDIVVDDIDIEYNGGGHDLEVKIGSMTQEEFNQKEIIRNNIVKREGWKRMTIISRKDKLPSDEKLLELLSYSRNFFSENPERSWIEFDIDKGIVRNALNKDGQEYDFGELRTLPRKSA